VTRTFISVAPIIVPASGATTPACGPANPYRATLRVQGLRGGGRWSQQPLLPCGRGIDDGPVLGHDPVEAVQVGEAAPELVELAPGDQDQVAATDPHPLKGGDGRRIHHTVARDRAFEVDNEREDAQHVSLSL
jgi:hypothetical protein